PELLIKAVQRGSPHQLIAYADPELLASRARQIGLPLTILSPDTATRPLNPGELCVKPMPLTAPSTAGRLDPANAEYVLRTLDQACSDCLSGEVGCLITGPVHKGVINDSGVNFSGHTEYLAEKCGGKPVVMMLANNAMKVALATTHLPLRNVPDAITAESLEQTLRILHSDLISKFGIQNPRILVCGLNPHAG
ncbi:MAG: 4-hydroxythreonine-4-phosphate dehydrogenase PdxA, partial [bacterium]